MVPFFGTLCRFHLQKLMILIIAFLDSECFLIHGTLVAEALTMNTASLSLPMMYCSLAFI